jgi:hypothetical protein
MGRSNVGFGVVERQLSRVWYVEVEHGTLAVATAGY